MNARVLLYFHFEDGNMQMFAKLFHLHHFLHLMILFQIVVQDLDQVND